MSLHGPMNEKARLSLIRGTAMRPAPAERREREAWQTERRPDKQAGVDESVLQ